MNLKINVRLGYRCFLIIPSYLLKLHTSKRGAVVAVVVIVWWLDLQLHMQSVPITTNSVSSNPAGGNVYSIQHHAIKSGFLRILWFHSPIKTDRHDITEKSLNVALSTMTRDPSGT